MRNLPPVTLYVLGIFALIIALGEATSVIWFSTGFVLAILVAILIVEKVERRKDGSS